jgi:hypothetical protein
MENKIDLQIAISNLDTEISLAAKNFHEWVVTGSDWHDPSWLFECCFLQLLAISEALSLPEFRKLIYDEFVLIQKSKNGINASGVDEDGSVYSETVRRIRCYLRALKKSFYDLSETTVTKDLLQILRDIHYVITDKAVFQKAPENEKDVHIRIEAILKCVFPDLKHQPVLTKTIKNFIPDTGISSLKTLLEYKFLSRSSDVARIADEVLADTRGYVSKEWDKFLYVIYETNRFRTENDWNRFLRESEISLNTSIVVLGGEPLEKEETKS